jgi:hypothetical protein
VKQSGFVEAAAGSATLYEGGTTKFALCYTFLLWTKYLLSGIGDAIDYFQASCERARATVLREITASVSHKCLQVYWDGVYSSYLVLVHYESIRDPCFAPKTLQDQIVRALKQSRQNVMYLLLYILV